MSERPHGTEKYETIHIPELGAKYPMYVHEYGTYYHMVWQPGNGIHYELTMMPLEGNHLRFVGGEGVKQYLCVFFPGLRSWAFAHGAIPSPAYICEKYKVGGQDAFVLVAMLAVALETEDFKWPLPGVLGV